MVWLCGGALFNLSTEEKAGRSLNQNQSGLQNEFSTAWTKQQNPVLNNKNNNIKINMLGFFNVLKRQNDNFIIFKNKECVREKAHQMLPL